MASRRCRSFDSLKPCTASRMVPLRSIRNDVGIAVTPIARAHCAFGPLAMSKFVLCAARKTCASFGRSSISTAMIFKPALPKSRCNAFMKGNDSTHGAHHDAQKSTYRTRPRNSAGVAAPLFILEDSIQPQSGTVVTAKAGAGRRHANAALTRRTAFSRPHQRLLFGCPIYHL